MKITAQDLLGFKVIDEIIPEPTGGAHREPAAAIATVGAAVAAALDELGDLDAPALREQRRDRFFAIGRFEAEAAPA
jgi:acetyl-CoA carboxylase carboxyl transferase subunit alpha